MNYSEDIEIKDGDASYYFRFLKWDTEFFGKRSYILEPEKSTFVISPVIKDMIENTFPDCFITAKIDSYCSRDLLEFFQSLGFRYIDTEVTLKYSKFPKDANPEYGNIEIIKIEKNENLPYDELGSVYSLTRFHYDIHISREKADFLWVSYIKSYKPSPTRHMFIARLKGEIAGAILVNESQETNRAVLFFVSVLEKYRGKKVGVSLIRHITRYFVNSELVTGTQIRNIKALNFYIKNGFSLIEMTKIVMHRWGNEKNVTQRLNHIL